jgi:hypothetical protein
MRVTIFSLAIIAAGLLGAPQTASAQTLLNYPWCLIQAAEGHVSCSFQTREQCLGTAARGGLDGNCYQNWDYKPFPGGLPPPVVDTTARTVYTYKYCGIPSTDRGHDCYYDTLEDCHATLSGVTGNCYPNPAYRPPAAPAPRGRVVAKKRSNERNDR